MVKVGRTDIPIFLIGDSGYPLSSWLTKPFAHNSNLTSSQRSFNYHLSRACILVENAFGRLKTRWRRLMKSNDMTIDNNPCVVIACCILHNMCEVHMEIVSMIFGWRTLTCLLSQLFRFQETIMPILLQKQLEMHL